MKQDNRIDVLIGEKVKEEIVEQLLIEKFTVQYCNGKISSLPQGGIPGKYFDTEKAWVVVHSINDDVNQPGIKRATFQWNQALSFIETKPGKPKKAGSTNSVIGIDRLIRSNSSLSFTIKYDKNTGEPKLELLEDDVLKIDLENLNKYIV